MLNFLQHFESQTIGTRHAIFFFLIYKIWNTNSVSYIPSQSIESWFCSNDARSAVCRGFKTFPIWICVLVITISAQQRSQVRSGSSCQLDFLTLYCAIKIHFIQGTEAWRMKYNRLYEF